MKKAKRIAEAKSSARSHAGADAHANVRLGSRVGRFLLAGTLAASMMSATALSAFAATINPTDDQGSNTLNLKLADQEFTYTDAQSGEEVTEIVWGDGKWTTYDTENGVYVWSTYIKGDDSHYGHYDVNITFNVNEDGELVAVDLTSDGTTFGGKWGNISKTSTITGYLPDDVVNTTTTFVNSDGYNVVTPSLSGTAAYDTEGNGGYAISSVTLYAVDENGEIDQYVRDENGEIIYDEVYDESDGDIDSVPRAKEGSSKSIVMETTATTSRGETTYTYATDDDDATVDEETGSIIVKNEEYNLVEVTYQIGSFFKFTQYTALDENAEKYEIEVTDYDELVSGIGAKNRDNYTLSVYAIMLQHELAVFDSEGGIEVDTISSATKSSHAIQEAVYAAQGYSYPVTNKDSDPDLSPTQAEWSAIFTSVSDELQLTIDAYSDTEETQNVWDETSAVKNEDGSVTINLENFDDSLAIGSIALYSIDDELSGEELFDLGSKNGATMVDADADEDVSTTGHLEHWVTSTSAGHGVLDSLLSAEVSGDAVYDADSKTLTISNAAATHVVVGFSVAKTSQGGYGQVCVAYSIEDLLAAGDVNETIEALDGTSVSSIEEAEAAFDALSTVQKTYVSRSAVLVLAAYSEAVENLISFPDNSKYASDGTLNYYYESVRDMAFMGLINGYADTGLFGVNNAMTRGEFATILWRYACPEEYASYGGDYSGVSNTSGLPDVLDGEWYTAAVNWAVEQGIITGYDDTGLFGVNDPVTFEQQITMIARYVLGGKSEAEAHDQTVLSSALANGTNVYTDVSSVNSWARGAMAWSIEVGVTTGYDNGDGTYTLEPSEDVIRARAATILARAIQGGYLAVAETSGE